MSDLRKRLIEAAGQALERGVCDLNERTGDWWGPGQECGRRVGTTAVEAIMPIIEAELRVYKLLEQTIEVLEGLPISAGYWNDGDKWYLTKAKPLLDNLKALKKEGTE